MVDNLSANDRSALMGRVGQKNTKPEIDVRKILHSHGLRFRLHRRDLPGTPDITLPRHQTVIFVHGCFWHGHACPKGKLPKTRTAFWEKKISANRDRDAATNRCLESLGYRVIVIWECELKNRSRLEERILSAFPAEKS